MARTPFGPKPRLALLGLVGIVLSSQVLMGCPMQKARIVVMLSDAPSKQPVRGQFLRGFAIGEESLRRCGAEMASVQWTNLSDDQVPAAAIRSNGELQVVVAPPAADLRAFDQLAADYQIPVVLPYQRGSSLDTLRSLEHRSFLWPLTPSRDEDLKAVVEAAVAAG